MTSPISVPLRSFPTGIVGAAAGPLPNSARSPLETATWRAAQSVPVNSYEFPDGSLTISGTVVLIGDHVVKME